MNQTGSNKAIGSIAAGAFVTIGVWVAQQFAGVVVPAEVAAAATTLIGTIIVWLVPTGGSPPA